MRPSPNSHLRLARPSRDLTAAGGEFDADLEARLVDAGGTRVQARNPHWDESGITIADPDG